MSLYPKLLFPLLLSCIRLRTVAAGFSQVRVCTRYCPLEYPITKWNQDRNNAGLYRLPRTGYLRQQRWSRLPFRGQTAMFPFPSSSNSFLLSVNLPGIFGARYMAMTTRTIQRSYAVALPVATGIITSALPVRQVHHRRGGNLNRHVIRDARSKQSSGIVLWLMRSQRQKWHRKTWWSSL